jgi:hypothetical protein
MIGPRVIITAAHCLDGPTKKLSIYLGKEKDKANIIEADCSAHPMFFLNLNQTADFALCRLAEEIPGKDTSYEWLTTDHRVMVAAERLQLSGFGCKDDSEFNKPIKAEQAILRDGPAPLRNFGFVFASSGFQDNFLTVIDEGDGVYLCSGDSGGVVYVNLDNRGDVDNISQRLTGTRVVVAVNSALVSGDHRISLVARTTGSDFQKFLFDWMAKNPGLNICDYDRPDSEDLKVCRAMR